MAAILKFFKAQLVKQLNNIAVNIFFSFNKYLNTEAKKKFNSASRVKIACFQIIQN